MEFKSKTEIKSHHIILFSLLSLILVGFLLFIIESIQVTSSTNKNTFTYTIKIRDSIKEIDKVFNHAEVNVNILTDSIANSYDINKQNNKQYNMVYIKGIGGLVKSVLANSPGVNGAWFQLNADLPFSANAYNWYGFRDDQFIDLKSQFEEDPSTSRQITPEEDPYYFGALNNQKTTWSDIYTDPDSKVKMITISQPVYINGALVGVGGLDISVDNLKQILINMQSIFPNSELFLTDKDNKILLSQLLNDTKDEDKKEPFEDLLRQNQNRDEMIEYEDNGVDKTAIVLALSNKYNLVITFEDKSILVGFNNLLNTIYFIFIILFVLILMAFFVDFKQPQMNIEDETTPTEEGKVTEGFDPSDSDKS